MQVEKCCTRGLPVGICDLTPITRQHCVFRRSAVWHVGPIIITMTISFDGKICSKSRILSVFVNIDVFRSQLCRNWLLLIFIKFIKC